MGGCMGCHGVQGQNRPGSAGDFSVILAVGRVMIPEIPSLVEGAGLSEVPATGRSSSLNSHNSLGESPS